MGALAASSSTLPMGLLELVSCSIACFRAVTLEMKEADHRSLSNRLWPTPAHGPPPLLFIPSFSDCLKSPRVLWLNQYLARSSSFVYAKTTSLGNELGSLSWYVPPPHVRVILRLIFSFHFSRSGINTFLRTKRTERSSLRSGGAKSSGKDGDAFRHRSSLLIPSLIQCEDPGQPRWRLKPKFVDDKAPTKPHRTCCDLCRQVSGSSWQAIRKI